MANEERRGVRIGDVSGSAVVVGSHNSVRNTVSAEPVDERHAELLRGVRELRADLARLVPTPGTAALGEELAVAEDEISRTGRAAPERVGRLRLLLTDAGAVIAALASGVTVGQALTALGG